MFVGREAQSEKLECLAISGGAKTQLEQRGRVSWGMSPGSPVLIECHGGTQLGRGGAGRDAGSASSHPDAPPWGIARLICLSAELVPAILVVTAVPRH